MASKFDMEIGSVILSGASPTQMVTISRKAELAIVCDGMQLLLNRLGDYIQLTVVSKTGEEEILLLSRKEQEALTEYMDLTRTEE